MATIPQQNGPRSGIVPWGLHPLPEWIAESLNRRIYDYDANPSSDIEVYSGPKTAWARVFSNGKSSLATGLEGFVLGGAEGFNESYGFGGDSKTVIGVDARGNPHEISAVATDGILGIPNDLPHRPPPSLVSIESELLGGQNSSFPGLCRKIKVSFKCHNLTQLKYLVPYFFTPRITVVVEWGWNNYNVESLVDLSDLDGLKQLFTTPEFAKKRIEKSNGSYDVGMGYITDFGYSLSDAGGYDCSFTITNANFLIEGQSHQNTSIKKNKTDSETDSQDKNKIQLKDFNEFVFDDMGSLSIKTKKTIEVKKTRTISSMSRTYQPILREEEYTSRERVDLGKTFVTEGRVFKPDKNPSAPANNDQKTWMRMDLIVEILNTFFSLKLLDENANDSGVNINQFNITNVKIAAHPGLKSTNLNVLLPNQYAPRFVTRNEKSSTNSSGTLDQVMIEDSSYLSLFKQSVEDVISNNNFTNEYDDLREIINPNSNSFPVYKNEGSVDPFGNTIPGKYTTGYWGYLSDVFINVEFFKTLVEKYDTLKTLVEALLQHISQAMCNIAQLKLITAGDNNSMYTVNDANLTPIVTKADAVDLPTIRLNSIDSAYLRSANLSIKMSSEMGNQMVMQSASGKTIPSQYGQGNVDPKTMKVSRFSRGDRLFDVGVFDQLVESNKTVENKKSKYTRMFSDNGSFYLYKKQFKSTESTIELTRTGTRQGTRQVSTIKGYILIEKDKSFMNSVVNNKQDKKASYINNPIMPGTTFEFELLGIGGITYLSQFTLANVLDQYSYENAVWQIANIKHKVEDKVWTTSITAQVRPLTTV
jgi:hypothetical protein